MIIILFSISNVLNVTFILKLSLKIFKKLFCFESVKHDSISDFRYSETAEKLTEITNPLKYQKYLRPSHKGELIVSSCCYAIQQFTVILI